MKKLAYGDGTVYVSLTTTEFSGLSGKVHSNVPDGTEISLSLIKQKIDLVDNKSAELGELKTVCSQMITKLTNIGI